MRFTHVLRRPVFRRLCDLVGLEAGLALGFDLSLALDLGLSLAFSFFFFSRVGIGVVIPFILHPLWFATTL